MTEPAKSAPRRFRFRTVTDCLNPVKGQRLEHLFEYENKI